MEPQSDITSAKRAIGAAGVLGLFSTIGDWLWASFIPDGNVVAGVIHGTAIFFLLALVLAAAAATRTATRRLLPTLPFAGLLIAGAFYPIAMVAGYLGGLLACWFLMWIALASLQRWARGSLESWSRALVRGVGAAILSGLAFGAISGIWTRPDPEPNYLVRLLYWTFAFLPGFLALLWSQPPAQER